jgi:hypothetical protein
MGVSYERCPAVDRQPGIEPFSNFVAVLDADRR